ncbi:hypothetical protein CLU79DRAFT_847965 [Phycomyces nitens]|nr:hypothetical protein CLU79DRAFT_847965 [Phycomyces nitens]
MHIFKAGVNVLLFYICKGQTTQHINRIFIHLAKTPQLLHRPDQADFLKYNIGNPPMYTFSDKLNMGLPFDTNPIIDNQQGVQFMPPGSNEHKSYYNQDKNNFVPNNTVFDGQFMQPQDTFGAEGFYQPWYPETELFKSLGSLAQLPAPNECANEGNNYLASAAADITSSG